VTRRLLELHEDVGASRTKVVQPRTETVYVSISTWLTHICLPTCPNPGAAIGASNSGLVEASTCFGCPEAMILDSAKGSTCLPSSVQQETRHRSSCTRHRQAQPNGENADLYEAKSERLLSTLNNPKLRLLSTIHVTDSTRNPNLRTLPPRNSPPVPLITHPSASAQHPILHLSPDTGYTPRHSRAQHTAR